MFFLFTILFLLITSVAFFVRSFYKKMVGRQIVLEDLQSIVSDK